MAQRLRAFLQVAERGRAPKRANAGALRAVVSAHTDTSWGRCFKINDFMKDLKPRPTLGSLVGETTSEISILDRDRSFKISLRPSTPGLQRSGISEVGVGAELRLWLCSMCHVCEMHTSMVF